MNIKNCISITAKSLLALSLLGLSPWALAADKRLNVPAISMFFIFVVMTLLITVWAARRTRSTSDFYTAGGGITGFQNGLAIAGDYMSAATLLGFTAMIYMSGVDAYIYMVAFFAGWPVILFLMAERLRNLGKFTFVDITSYRFKSAQNSNYGGDQFVDCGVFLSGGANGRCRSVDSLIIRLRVHASAVYRRRLNDYLCHLWRHGSDHLGADH